MAYTVIGGRLVKTKTGKSRNKGYFRWPETVLVPQVREPDPDAPDPKLKGVKDGNCNVTACQRPGATWWNTSRRAYYCPHCAADINRWSKHDEGIEICFPSKEYADEVLKAANRAF